VKPLPAFRDEFPVSRTHIFLNHGGVSPTSTRVVDAVHAFMDATARVGRPSFDDWESLATDCRERFARLVGCAPDEVAFVRNTSHGLSLLAAGLDWRPGDRVAAAASVEYPSNVYPWMDLEERGVAALDVIPVDEAGTVTVEAAARALRPRTRVLAVSSAQYATGAVTDLAGLGQLCRERGVLLCVDGIQTVGALPLDVKAAGIHFLSADSHKWMLGMMGIGAVFVDRSVVGRIHPPLLGWRSTTDNFNFDRVHYELLADAGRFEEGSLAYPLIAGFAAALELLEEAGIDRIADHVCGLVTDLLERERLKDLESEALDLWQSEVRERGLRMRVLECSYNLDGGQLTVSYRASGKRRRQREMRNLQRDMARSLKARIEMREVRDREAAKLLDGVGKCGRQLCCTTWLREFRHIRPEMARTQQLTENRDEITGVCGRLLCCLSYEDEMYRSLTRSLPKVGARVVTPQGAGKVRYIFPLKKTVTVTLENDINAEFGVDELLPPKQDPSCGSCGGCTATRRAEGEREAEQRAQDQQATAT